MVPSSGRAPPALENERVADRHAGAMDPRLDRADLDARHDRDLLVREALDVAEEQGGALFGGHVSERLLDRRSRLMTGGDVDELGTRCGRFGPRDILVLRRFERQLGTTAPLTHPIN